MAKKKQEPTKAQIAMTASAAKLKAAKAAAEKADNEKNRAAVTAASDEHKANTKVVNRERFVSVGNARAGKAISAIDLCGNIANKRSYDFTQEDADKFIKALQDAVTSLKAKFTAALGSAGSTTKATKAALFE